MWKKGVGKREEGGGGREKKKEKAKEKSHKLKIYVLNRDSPKS